MNSTTFAPPLSLYRITIKEAATKTRFLAPYPTHFCAIHAAVAWLIQNGKSEATGIRIEAKKIQQGTGQ